MADRTFTDRDVFTIPPPAQGRAAYKCAKGPTGFTLHVTANGHRSYYMVYEPKGGHTRHKKIGNADEMSYKGARDEAERLRGIIKSGLDPLAEEQAERKAKASAHVVTLRECISGYLDANRHAMDSKTIGAYEQTRDALPRSFVDSPAEELDGKTFRAAMKETTSAPIMQNRHLGRLKAVLRFAHGEKTIARLPALLSMKKPHAEVKRSRFLTSAEIRALWHGLDEIAPTMPRCAASNAASVRLMLLLGTRFSETVKATWSEFDLDGSAPRADAVPKGQPMWYIPAEHRKKVGPVRKDHWIPLPPLAVSILRAHRAVTGEKPLAFYQAGAASRTYRLGKLLDAMTANGNPEAWTYHDLRRTCATGLGEMGCPDDLNNLVLGHTKKGANAAYDHSKRIPERADWLRRWADHVADVAGLSKPQPDSILYVYETAEGLPELKGKKEASHGARLIGGFPALEAIRKAEEMTRALLIAPKMKDAKTA